MGENMSVMDKVAKAFEDPKVVRTTGSVAGALLGALAVYALLKATDPFHGEVMTEQPEVVATPSE